MVKNISLVELKSNPNYLDPRPNSPLTKKNKFYFDPMYTKERTHLLESFGVRNNLGIKDGPTMTLPNEILGIFQRYNVQELLEPLIWPLVASLQTEVQSLRVETLGDRERRRVSVSVWGLRNFIW